MESTLPVEEEKEPMISLELEKTQSVKLPKGTFEVLNSGKFEDKYLLGMDLGHGAFGTVNICTLKSNNDVTRAVKKVIKKPPGRNQD